jgi:hypothetical protein
MLEIPEVRREIVALRSEALHRSAGRLPVGPLGRAVGAALVRLGRRVEGHHGSLPALVTHHRHREGAPAAAPSGAPARAARLRGSAARA